MVGGIGKWWWWGLWGEECSFFMLFACFYWFLMLSFKKQHFTTKILSMRMLDIKAWSWGLEIKISEVRNILSERLKKGNLSGYMYITWRRTKRCTARQLQNPYNKSSCLTLTLWSTGLNPCTVFPFLLCCKLSQSYSTSGFPISLQNVHIQSPLKKEIGN